MEPYKQLEKEWAEFNQLDPAGMVCCSSGTAALHLALEALQLPAQSKVLVPDYTMVACARAVTLAGLRPVFVDCDETLNVDMRLLFNYCVNENRRVGAIMAVHVYGRRCPMEWFDGLDPDESTEHDVKLIEDLAEAHGVRPHKLTDAACWSFYKNKIVAGEEGGAVWFRDPKHAGLARQLRSLGFTEAHDYLHVPRGHNYRMSNPHAEIILKSIRSYSGCWHCGGKGYHDGWGDDYSGGICGVCSGRGGAGGNAAERRRIESWYDAACPDDWRMPKRDAVWVYDVRMRGKADDMPSPGIPTWDRKDLMAVVHALNAKGIAARAGFAPMRWQSEYKDCWTVDAGKGLPQSEKAALEVLYLPVQPGRTTEADCRRAFEVVRRMLKQ